MTHQRPQWPAPYPRPEPLSPARQRALGQSLARQLKLPEATASELMTLYRPLAQHWAHQVGAMPILAGINGAQGTGKSTAAFILQTLLRECHGLAVCQLSIDDLYLSRAAREDLARETHPLLATRGVPGTHDLAGALALFERLKTAQQGQQTLLPRFDKARDDVCPQSQWPSVTGRPQIVILEGWCVGARAEPAERLQQPVNELEMAEDADGRWRRYVNDCLADYQLLFGQLDSLVMLKAPSFDQVLEWRQLQEDKLRQSLSEAELARSQVMSPDEVKRFIAHYERLTRWMLAEMPERADAVLALDADHQIATIEGHTGPTHASH